MILTWKLIHWSFVHPLPVHTRVVELPLVAVPESKESVRIYGLTSLPSVPQVPASPVLVRVAHVPVAISYRLKVVADKVPAQFSAGIKDNKLFTELTKPVAGGRVFTTALLNIFIADDGRIFVGSVTTQRLLEVAAQ